MPSKNLNPIIPGFAPDPSVVFIKDTFFLVNSTFHLFPGLPIYASKDLISWEHIGNAINRPGQLSLVRANSNLCEPNENGEIMIAAGGLYAPTIRHHNGITYVVCTNVIHDGSHHDPKENFIVSTNDIWSDKWNDAVPFDFNGIDPSIFFDDDGRSYLQGSGGHGPMTHISLFEIDLKTGKKLSEEKVIWGGTGGIFPEGPHLYKKDGWYYLVISEGGTYDDHMITVARSKDVWGPYTAHESNPILTARGTDEYIQYTGHSDMFQDQEGRWWGVCLGARRHVDQGVKRYIMGRETFLTPAEWSEGEWPSMTRVKLNPVLKDGTAIARAESTPRLSARPMVDFLYIGDPVLSNHVFSNDNKTITLAASKDDLSQWGKPVTFVAKRQRELEGNASVTMLTGSHPVDAQVKAGLAYYKEEHRYIKLFYDYASSSIMFEEVNVAKKISKSSKASVTPSISLSFHVEYTEKSYTFSYKVDSAASWTILATVDTLDLTAQDFIGPVIGVFATSKVDGVKVQFDNLTVE